LIYLHFSTEKQKSNWLTGMNITTQEVNFDSAKQKNEGKIERKIIKVTYNISPVSSVVCIGGYSVLGWNHPGFGGSTVSEHQHTAEIHEMVLVCMCFIQKPQ